MIERKIIVVNSVVNKARVMLDKGIQSIELPVGFSKYENDIVENIKEVKGIKLVRGLNGLKLENYTKEEIEEVEEREYNLLEIAEMVGGEVICLKS